MQLDHLDYLPEALRDLSPQGIKQVFPNPTLIHIPGKRPEPVFISTMLHGNETTSFRVLQHLEQRFSRERPPRSLMIFVGNVDAAAQGVRHLDGQPDFNRFWSNGPGQFHATAQEIVREARRRRVFASIDIHNNTGKNPIYGCVNVLRPADLQMLTSFAPVGVYYLNPPTTQSVAFSRLCPSITLECGQSEDPDGIASATRLVEEVIALDRFETSMPGENAIALYQTVGRVTIDPECSFSFGESSADLILRDDLETLNFSPLNAGEVWGYVSGSALPLRVLDEHGQDLTAEFLQFRDGVVSLTRAVTPSMITTDHRVIRQDCLCYFMQAI